ncbi:elongation factor G [Prevotella sp.]|uniref:elongation factor G n=1 Tax=Prevotella sp. TaxID=59823 RepID=UPI003080FB1E
MRVYQTNEIKNIALLGSAGSGKTTLAEAMLFESGVIKRRGTIEAKNTVSDYFPVEQEYGYSVFSTVFNVEWNNKKLNIIDCPGSDDFVGGAITALNVTDQALVLINGQYGPEVGTQNLFRYTEKLKKPVIFLINQLDSEKCDFDSIIASMDDIYGAKCVQIQYPLQTGPEFNSLIDVLLMKKYSWKPEGGAPIIEDIPAEEMDKALELHKALVEAAAENDETLMEKFFEEETLTEDELREGIRKGLITRSIFPVFCVCAGKSMGVRRLMEFLGNVVPFVDEMPKVHNTRGEEIPAESDKPTSLYFFKTGVEPHIGDVSYFKVMSGSVKAGDDLANADRGSKERIANLYVCAGANRQPIEQLMAGDIGCTVKLKDVKTGNTLNGKGAENKFDFIKYPNSKYSRAIKAKNEADTEKLMAALIKMRQEDPTWVVEQSKELRQTIVHGQGEFHLRTLKWGGKLVFINSVVGGAIDQRFMPAILKGIMERMEQGPLTGSYARDVRVIVYDGKMHPVDSNELSFMLAARAAFSEAFRNAGPKILEPIYDLEVFVPSDYMGDVMSDLQGRRALIMGMDSEAGYQKLQAKIPLKELSNYSISLSSITGGRASFTTKFASYELVPNDIQQTLIKEHEAEMEGKE